MSEGASATQRSVDVSAILIARNEEGVIARAMEAVLQALDRGKTLGLFELYEVWLVDSASTDRTVEIASRYPVSIARLRSNWPLSAAAGRATGARLTSGGILFFVDGDYVLDAEWLRHAWKFLANPKVGGVTGWDLDEVSGETILAKRWNSVRKEDIPPTTDVDSIASGLIRHEAYREVGGIHPYLYGAEDRDLGGRLRGAGWRIVKTQEPMGVHVWSGPGRPLTYVDYYRSVSTWSVGDGQACRARWRSRTLRTQFLRRYATLRYLIHDFQFLFASTLVLANLAAAMLGGLTLLAVGSIDVALGLVLDSLRRRRRKTWAQVLYELQGPFYGPYRQTLFVIGLLRRSLPPETYPRDVEIVQRRNALSPRG